MKNTNLRINIKAFNKTSKAFSNLRKNVQKTSRFMRFAAHSSRRSAQGFANFGAAMNRSGRRAKNFGRSMTTNVSAPIALAGAGILKVAHDFGESMNELGAISKTLSSTGGPTEAFNEMREMALKMGEKTKFSAVEAANAMTFFSRAGFKSGQIMKAIAPTLDLAAAGNIDVARSADIASNIMGAFGIDAGKMSKVADTLAFAINNSNMNLDQLGETMREAAPVAKSFGVSLETTSAIAGLLGNIGLQGSIAGTQMKAFFTRLAKPNTKTQKMFKDLGLSVSDANGNFKDINVIFSEFGQAMDKMPQNARLAAISEMFGLRGIAGGANLLSQAAKNGVDPIGKFTKEIMNAEGTADEMSKVMMLGLPGAVKRFQAGFVTASVAIADSGLLEFAVKAITKFTSFFKEISKTNPKLLKMGTIALGVTALAGPLIFAVGSLTMGIGLLSTGIGHAIVGFGMLKAGLIKAIPFMWGFVAPILAAAAPIAIIVAKIALVAAGVWSLIKVLGLLGKAVHDAFTTPTKFVDALSNRFSNGLGSVKKLFSFGGFGSDDDLTPVQKRRKLGASQVKKAVDDREFVSRTNNSHVSVDFKNTPKNTIVKSKSDGGLDLNFMNGMLGEF